MIKLKKMLLKISILDILQDFVLIFINKIQIYTLFQLKIIMFIDVVKVIKKDIWIVIKDILDLFIKLDAILLILIFF